MTGHLPHARESGLAGHQVRGRSSSAIGEVTLVTGQGRRLPGSGATVLRHISRHSNSHAVTSAWPP
jgi:hypothetical protein